MHVLLAGQGGLEMAQCEMTISSHRIRRRARSYGHDHVGSSFEDSQARHKVGAPLARELGDSVSYV